MSEIKFQRCNVDFKRNPLYHIMKCQTTPPCSAGLRGRTNLCRHLPHHPSQPIRDYPKTEGSVLTHSHLINNFTGHDGEGGGRRGPARLLLGRRGRRRDPVAGVDRVGGGVHLLARLVVDDVLPGRRRGIGLGTVSGGGLGRVGHGRESEQVPLVGREGGNT